MYSVNALNLSPITLYAFKFIQAKCWIGLDDRDDENNYTWIDGSPLDFTNWGSNQSPANNGPYLDRDCVDVGTQANPDKWSQIDCSIEKYVICNIENPTPSPTTDPTYSPTSDPTIDPTSDPTSDPTDDPTMEPTGVPTQSPTLQSSNGNYILIPKLLNFEDAETYCNNVYGTNLASIHNNDERREIQNLCNPSTNQRNKCWIGLSDRDDENNYSWIDESPLDFTNWGSNQSPANNGPYLDRDCVDVGTQANADKWSQIDCFIEKYVICNIENPTSSPTDEPTIQPTAPSTNPTTNPSTAPTTTEPTDMPSEMPSKMATDEPTSSPSPAPITTAPSNMPSEIPTQEPTNDPSAYPTLDPTYLPTLEPTELIIEDGESMNPSSDPTTEPTINDEDGDDTDNSSNAYSYPYSKESQICVLIALMVSLSQC